MITTDGKTHFLRYVAGIDAMLADQIVIGVGSSPESVDDFQLDHEYLRLAITSVSADVANGELVFKTTIPPEASGQIYEIGLMKNSSVDLQGFYNSLLTSFNVSDQWSSGSIKPGLRAGGGSLSISSLSSSTVNWDLSYYTNPDIFNLAINADSDTSLNVRFGLNSDNYFETNLTISKGYQIVKWNKEVMNVVGNPAWSTINYVSFTPNNSVLLDSLRVQRTNIVDNTFSLIDRKVMSTPLSKVAGGSLELEYSLKVL